MSKHLIKISSKVYFDDSEQCEKEEYKTKHGITGKISTWVRKTKYKSNYFRAALIEGGQKIFIDAMGKIRVGEWESWDDDTGWSWGGGYWVTINKPITIPVDHYDYQLWPLISELLKEFIEKVKTEELKEKLKKILEENSERFREEQEEKYREELRRIREEKEKEEKRMAEATQRLAEKEKTDKRLQQIKEFEEWFYGASNEAKDSKDLRVGRGGQKTRNKVVKDYWDCRVTFYFDDSDHIVGWEVEEF